MPTVRWNEWPDDEPAGRPAENESPTQDTRARHEPLDPAAIDGSTVAP